MLEERKECVEKPQIFPSGSDENNAYLIVPLVKLAPEQIEMEINNGNSCGGLSFCRAFFVAPSVLSCLRRFAIHAIRRAVFCLD